MSDRVILMLTGETRELRRDTRTVRIMAACASRNVFLGHARTENLFAEIDGVLILCRAGLGSLSAQVCGNIFRIFFSEGLGNRTHHGIITLSALEVSQLLHDVGIDLCRELGVLCNGGVAGITVAADACGDIAGGVTAAVERSAFGRIGFFHCLGRLGIRRKSQRRNRKQGSDQGIHNWEKRTFHSNTLRLDIKILSGRRITMRRNPLLYNSFSAFSPSPAFSIPMSLLWQARFFTTANHLRDLPKTQVPEIAFAGRSNAGKSTAINILCNQKRLAFASKTPGRTQHINYFSIGGAHVGQHRKDEAKADEIQAFLVDLPGYGYAEVAGTAKLHWQELLGDYVQQREQLAALILIMDARRPFTELDTQMLEWFAPTGKPIHCLLTKADKLNRNEQTNALRLANTVLKSYVDEGGQLFPFTVQLFSALKRQGLEEANDKILALLKLEA